MALSHSPQIVRDGLVLYLDAANIKSYPGSGTTWFDTIGKNNAILYNGATFNIDNKGYINFDGINDYAIIPNNTITSDIYTIMFFYKPEAGHSSFYPAFFNGLTTAGRFTLFWFSTSAISLQHRRTDSIQWIRTSTVAPTLNQWNFIHIIIDASTPFFRVGVNLNQSTSQVSSQFVEPDTEWTFGRRNVANYLNSSIANLQIYNRILTEQEIKQNFNATRGRYGI